MNKALFGLILFLASGLVFAQQADFKNFELVRPGYQFEFPRDHGSHPNYPNEWWYFTGHAKAVDGRTFGFEITFFRVAVRRTELLSQGPFAAQSLFLAHMALTDDKNQEFYHADRVSRDSLLKAGSATDRLSVWLDDWKADMTDNSIIVSANAEFGGFNLNLQPQKAVVLQGKNGVSVKGPGTGNASLYMSFTRLLGQGEIKLGDESIPVTVSAWMDHEVLSSNLDTETLGWDWFAIQLDNNEELMLYQLRQKDVSISAFSSGSYIRSDSTVEKLSSSDFAIISLDQWRSSKTNIVYPSGWRIEIPKLAASFVITPTVKDQELETKQSTGITYWEGRALTSGTLAKQNVNGNAYVELVGYK